MQRFGRVHDRDREGANLRRKPQGAIITALPHGTRLEILRGIEEPIIVDGYGWYEVRALARDLTGFVGAELVELDPVVPDCPPPAPPSEPEPARKPFPWPLIAALAVGIIVLAVLFSLSL